MGGNIPSGNFLGGNFPGGNFPGASLMGGNFPGGNFPRTVWCAYLKAYWNFYKSSLTILSNLQPSFVSLLLFKKEKEWLKVSIIQ